MKEQLKLFLKKAGVYHPLQIFYRSAINFIVNQFYKATYRKFRGRGFACNFCGARYEKFVPEYPSVEIRDAIYRNNVIAGYGQNVYCPNCMSKNRERLIKDVIDNYLDIENRKVLHFSPERKLYNVLKRRALVTTVDINPRFYVNIDDSIIFADATQLQFADGSFDIIIANHIMEHIPDDVRAMKEIHRVLKDNGVAVLQVPYSETLAGTIESPGINDPAEQAALYGQKDHVRIYAFHDYIHRLEISGFSVNVLEPDALSTFRVHAIQEKECVFLCYKKLT